MSEIKKLLDFTKKHNIKDWPTYPADDVVVGQTGQTMYLFHEDKPHDHTNIDVPKLLQEIVEANS